MKRRDFVARSASAVGCSALAPNATPGFATTAQAPPFVRFSAFDARARLETYRRAVAEMRRRSAEDENDPTGWTFQAGIHGSFTNSQDFNKCEHASWWFLSWHRAYLYFFERIVRQASGDPTFTLPYWDWNTPNRRSLPAPFRDPASELFDGTRVPSVNAGEPLLANETDVQQALDFPAFLGTRMRPGFGGVPLPLRVKGGLERPPHDTVHVLISGNMGDPKTAATDPIFWLHYANVDRLWDVWLARGRSNPSQTDWQTHTPFIFFDENRNRVQVRTSEFLPAGARLDYRYDDLGGNAFFVLRDNALRAKIERDVNSAVAAAGAPAQTKAQREAFDARRRTIFGAESSLRLSESTSPVTLTGSPVTVSIPLDARRQSSLNQALSLAREDFEDPPSVILALEGVQSSRPPGVVFRVFLDEPMATAETDPQAGNYVGSLTLFGAAGAPQHGHDHGEGESYFFDVTGLVQNLKERGKWDDANVKITFVSKGVGDANQPNGEVQVRKISLSLAR